MPIKNSYTVDDRDLIIRLWDMTYPIKLIADLTCLGLFLYLEDSIYYYESYSTTELLLIDYIKFYENIDIFK